MRSACLLGIILTAACEDPLVEAEFPVIDPEGRDAVECNCRFAFPDAEGVCKALESSCLAAAKARAGGCAPKAAPTPGTADPCPFVFPCVFDENNPCPDDDPNSPPLTERADIEAFIDWWLTCEFACGFSEIPDDKINLDRADFACQEFEQLNNATCAGASFSGAFCIAGAEDAGALCAEICTDIAYQLDWQLASDMVGFDYKCGEDPDDPAATCAIFDGTCNPHTVIVDPLADVPLARTLAGAVPQCAEGCQPVLCRPETIDTCTQVQLPTRVPVPEDGGVVDSEVEECHRGFESGVFCRVPESPLAGGVLQEMSTRRSRGILDDDAFAEIARSDFHVRTRLRGTVDILGEPCPNAACAVSFRILVTGDDVSAGACELVPFAACEADDDCDVHVLCLAGQCIDLSGECAEDTDCPVVVEGNCVSTNITKITLHAATGTEPAVAIDANGNGTIPEMTMTGTIHLEADGVPRARTGGLSPFTVHVDWDGRRFTLEDGFALEDFSAHTYISGTIVNQPPTANAGADFERECSSPQGTTVELIGRADDPDGFHDVMSMWWRRGEAAFFNEEIARNLVGFASAPLGDSSFIFVVQDRSLQLHGDSVRVGVVDTTPPDLASFLYQGPLCFWPPNHDYVVLDVARDVEALVTDQCDPHPRIVITGADSSQVDDGFGDGSTTDDVVVFSDHVCLRTERQGGALEGRSYRVHFAARDASGNESDPTVEILVGHDERPDTRCTDIALEEVDDGDPRCIPVVEPAAVVPGSCATSRGNGWSAVLLGLLIVGRRRKVRAAGAPVASLLLFSCAPAEEPAGSIGADDEPSGEVAGTWGGTPFAVASTTAYYQNGDVLMIVFHDYVSECPWTLPEPPDGERSLYFFLYPDAQTVGLHQVRLGEFDVGARAVTQASDAADRETRILTEGAIDLETLNGERIVGSLTASDEWVALAVAGSFDMALCGGG